MASSPSIAPSTGQSRPSKLAIPPTVPTISSPCSAVSSSAGASTPTSAHHSQLAVKLAAGSPQAVLGMATEAAAQPQVPKNSITSKEWVIPPRPKPGRKPATDTPPTKRKAQNRAAQRAFRERRAARVGELEEQMDEQRDQYERVQLELQDRANGLEVEVQSLRGRCSILEDMLQKERLERSKISSELDIMRRRWTDAISQNQTPRASIDSSHSGPKSYAASLSISSIISPPNPSDLESSTNQTSTDAGCGSCDPNGSCACVDELLASTGPSIDCGKCSLGTRCECLESLPSLSTTQESDLKRRPSSFSAQEPDEKRQKSNVNENEIDFTAMFSKKVQSAIAEPVLDPFQPPLRSLAIPPRDSCGFCTDGTYCMCAEAAAAAASQATLAPMGSQVQTPPPSEDDVIPATMEFTSTGAVKLPRLQSLNRPAPARPATKANGCGANGPGTCAQCLADPKSGLFCRSLAASFGKQAGGAETADGCCGGSGGGGCCKANGDPSPSSLNPSSGSGLRLSCADAYKTLSSHLNFEEASDDINTWLPKLKAIPTPQEVGEGNHSRRLPIEVEAASIMSVLKDFDVRFGRGA